MLRAPLFAHLSFLRDPGLELRGPWAVLEAFLGANVEFLLFSLNTRSSFPAQISFHLQGTGGC